MLHNKTMLGVSVEHALMPYDHGDDAKTSHTRVINKVAVGVCDLPLPVKLLVDGCWGLVLVVFFPKQVLGIDVGRFVDLLRGAASLAAGCFLGFSLLLAASISMCVVRMLLPGCTCSRRFLFARACMRSCLDCGAASGCSSPTSRLGL